PQRYRFLRANCFADPNVAGHVSTRALTSAGISFREQLIVCEKHNRSGNCQLLRQVPRRRELLPCGQIPRKYGLPQPQVHLPEQRSLASHKWYRELHRKWIFQTTTNRAMLESLLTP